MLRQEALEQYQKAQKLGQKCYRLHMARYILIDVSFQKPSQTNMECSKISPFVHGNI